MVEKIVLLESKLAQATPDEEDAEDVTKYYNPMELDQIKDLLPQLSMQYLISALAPAEFKPEKLIVGSPSYLKALSEILRETSAEALQAYFVWKTVQAYAYRVEDDALKPLKRFNNELQGKDPDASEERWRVCTIRSKFFLFDSRFGPRTVYFVLSGIPFMFRSTFTLHTLLCILLRVDTSCLIRILLRMPSFFKHSGVDPLFSIWNWGHLSISDSESTFPLPSDIGFSLESLP